MKPEDINRACAELCGWTGIHLYEDDAGPSFWSGEPPEDYWKTQPPHLKAMRKGYGTTLPRFTESLDAAQMAFRALAKEQQLGAAFQLCGLSTKHGGLIAMSATPTQWCESILRAAGRWKGNQ